MSVNGQNEFGNTPLHKAMQNGDKKMISLLVDRGGDLRMLNSLNQTPIYFAPKKLICSMGLSKFTTNIVTEKSFKNLHAVDKELKKELDRVERQNRRSLIKREIILNIMKTAQQAKAEKTKNGSPPKDSKQLPPFNYF